MALNQVGLERLNTATTKKIGTSKNLIINGAMLVAQRGTSSTSAGYQTVDRIKVGLGGNDENPTLSQVDVASGTTPYTSGFRKALKITNGNQTSGAGASDFIKAQQDIEGQNILSSGWNATDPNSKLTISYWVKSSVAQTFYGRFRAFASSDYEYTYSFALSANTWTKVTKTVPGNSNFSSIPNTNAQGFFHIWQCFFDNIFHFFWQTIIYLRVLTPFISYPLFYIFIGGLCMFGNKTQRFLCDLLGFLSKKLFFIKFTHCFFNCRICF